MQTTRRIAALIFRLILAALCVLGGSSLPAVDLVIDASDDDED